MGYRQTHENDSSSESSKLPETTDNRSRKIALISKIDVKRQHEIICGTQHCLRHKSEGLFHFLTNLKKQQVVILPKGSLMIMINDQHIYCIKHKKQVNKKQATKDRKSLK